MSNNAWDIQSIDEGYYEYFAKQNMALSENKVPQNPMVYYRCPT